MAREGEEVTSTEGTRHVTTEHEPVVGAGGPTLEDVVRLPQVGIFLHRANENLAVLGFTEHGARHAGLVSHIARNVLLRLHYPPRMAELAAIAGYFHDIGNVAGRINHSHFSVVIAYDVLQRLGMDYDELALVLAAIGNHEEELGEAVNPVAAATIIGDKSDVHRSRVQNPDMSSFDIHDRVNYAAQYSFVRVDGENKVIALEVSIDTNVSTVMEYFEIFLPRMLMCRRATEFLGCHFELIINKVRLS